MAIQDPEAVWIMQGWMFSYGDFWQAAQIEAILSSVPSGRMIILDLDSTHNEQYTRTKSYYHLQPFIFNDLSNFGGGLGLFGRFENITHFGRSELDFFELGLEHSLKGCFDFVNGLVDDAVV